MEDYWYDIVQNDYFYFSAYFDEHPEADKEESVPSWWIKEAAGEQAMSLLNDWGSNDTVFGDKAAGISFRKIKVSGMR